MSTTRRPLGHGPQPRPADAPDTPATAPAERIRAAQADVTTTLPAADRMRADLARYRERGILAAPPPRRP
ncbi:hypothetical protein [Streptomyces sp. NPDC018045]|uniref:hypothetical protein n=1 Tax=Streptomyces sp. NPDC018045 TaxID=3365037 RepID=UPI0037992FAB